MAFRMRRRLSAGVSAHTRVWLRAAAFAFVGVFAVGFGASARASDCPDNFVAFAETTDPLQCTCSAEAANSGSVWGMDVYTGDSSICRAAVHAGVLTKKGGDVTVLPQPGRKAYPGLNRNGVPSSNYGAYASSFAFAKPGAPAANAAPAAQPAAPSPSPSPAPAPAPTAINDCPDNFASFADSTDPLTCGCTAEAADSGTVWGMDVYTGDSSICRAGRHAGVITRKGGVLTVVPEKGRSGYAGLNRNGVTSNNYGAFGSSFRFAPPGVTGEAAKAAPVATGPSQCPDNFASFADETDPLTCGCTAEAADSGTVWGMDVYTGDSSICRAARHAGVINKSGGLVTVVPDKGRSAYPGSSRNGVISNNYGAFGSSFRFAAAGGGTPQPQQKAASDIPPLTPSGDCPDNFVAFADSDEPLTCKCSAEQTNSGTVWGMDVYTGDSSLCRSALHAGAIGKGGGVVSAIPEQGRKAYPGSTRNGVISNNYGPFASSFRFDLRRAPTTTDGPVQRPVAEALKESGEVNLYVRFRTGSADLDPDAGSVLGELLAALQSDPSLVIGLTGHTDNVGTREYNIDLSHRRAEAVGYWLINRKIPIERVHVDGRGFDEPIADNATEQGRALNRRVNAKRLQ